MITSKKIVTTNNYAYTHILIIIRMIMELYLIVVGHEIKFSIVA